MLAIGNGVFSPLSYILVSKKHQRFFSMANKPVHPELNNPVDSPPAASKNIYVDTLISHVKTPHIRIQ